jgi:hypothetical protein
MQTMDIKIITEPLQLDIYGFGGIASNKDYTGTAFKLSGKTWDYVKNNNIKNKGKNIWVYEDDEKVFAGVELDNGVTIVNGLEKNSLSIRKYAYYKHTGAYQLIKRTGQLMTMELTNQGYEIVLPYIEIYGHWSADENELETELIMCLK